MAIRTYLPGGSCLPSGVSSVVYTLPVVVSVANGVGVMSNLDYDVDGRNKRQRHDDVLAYGLYEFDGHFSASSVSLSNALDSRSCR